LPNVKLKNGYTVIDPGGDPAAPGLHGQTSSGGFVESAGLCVSTQTVGWRQLVITRGGAAV
jgi:hypothetical protein